MDRGAWQATVHEASKESDMTECLKNSNNWGIQEGFPRKRPPSWVQKLNVCYLSSGQSGRKWKTPQTEQAGGIRVPWTGREEAGMTAQPTPAGG